MKGIILKDLYDNFRVGKNLASYILGGGFMILIALLGQSKFNFLWFTIVVATIFSSCMIESSCEQDERVNFDRVMMSFPLSKAQIVIARYLLALCCIAEANLLTFLFVLYSVFLRHTLPFREAMEYWAIALSFSIFFTGLTHICYYLFGKKIGTIFYVIMFVLLALGYSIGSMLIGLLGGEIGWTTLLIAALPLSVAIFTLSCLISIRIYRRKYA